LGGWGEAPFIEAMRRRMPDRVVANNLGSRFPFGAITARPASRRPGSQ